MATSKKKMEEQVDEINDAIITSEVESEVVEEQVTQEVEQPNPEIDEVLFLKRILHIQHEGGFGRHLDNIINERIKQLS